jgi:hypothetical protein
VTSDFSGDSGTLTSARAPKLSDFSDVSDVSDVSELSQLPNSVDSASLNSRIKSESQTENL